MNITFTTSIKNEITKMDTNRIESLTELNTYLKFNSTLTSNSITIFTENASVARRLFKLIKTIYSVSINLTIRQQRKFNKSILYILEVRDKVKEITNSLKNINIDSDEEKIAYLKGLFLACGSINDPKTSRYHLEFLVKLKKDADFSSKTLNYFRFSSKIIKRERGYMVYLKSSEEISDFIKLIGAINAVFYYEDIRIYRDHLNMVNRLNNCEQANTDKLVKTANNQVKSIEYLINNDLYSLLDEKTKIIADYRLKYKESSYQELADIISMETDYKITKSGVNHHFRKINDLISKHKK